MLERFRKLKKNTGWGGVIKTALVALLCAGIAIWGPQDVFIRPVLLGALILPALFSPSYPAAPGLWSKFLNVFGLTLMGSAFLGSYLRGYVEDLPYTVTAIWAALALYVSFFFWFWSHPEIVRLQED